MSKTNRNILTLAFIAFILFMYMPFIIAPFVNEFTEIDRIWDSIYEYLSPFTVLPITIGMMSIIMNIVHKNFFVKLLFVLLFIGTLLISFVAVMGMNSYTDLFFFTPHVILIIGHFVVWIKGIKRL